MGQFKACQMLSVLTHRIAQPGVKTLSKEIKVIDQIRSAYKGHIKFESLPCSFAVHVYNAVGSIPVDKVVHRHVIGCLFV